MTAAAAVTSTLLAECDRCGMMWRRRSKAHNARICPECGGGAPHVEPTPGERLAIAVTDYRLAIELATAALRLGRTRDALAYLEAIEAPTRPS